MIAATIYDPESDSLRRFDWTRPAFVQACRQAHFDECVGVVQARMGIASGEVVALVARTWQSQGLALPRRIVNPHAALSELTAAHACAAAVRDATIAVVISDASSSNAYEAMRTASNVCAFCLALDRPVVIVDNVGGIRMADDFFGVRTIEACETTVRATVLMRDEEIALLLDAADQAPAGHVVEIGRFAGGSTMLLASAARSRGLAPVWSVDRAPLAIASYVARLNRLDTCIRWIDADSAGAASAWGAMQQAPGIGLLLIDGDHTYDGVCRDLDAWLPFVIPGGRVLLHDAGMPDMGVSRAAHHHLQSRSDYQTWRRAGSLLAFTRDPDGCPYASAAYRSIGSPVSVRFQ